MDHIEKLLRKLSSGERADLLEVIEQLRSKGAPSNAQKIKGTDFYRVRKGRYRIIFHYESGEAVVDSIRLRNENTYKNL